MELDPLTSAYLEAHPAAAASSISQLSIGELAEFLAITPRATAAGVLTHMLPMVVADALSRMEAGVAADILQRMPNEPAVLTLRAMRRELHPAMFRGMPRAAAIRLRLQMRYPEALIGSLVDAEVLTLQPNQRASDALRQMKAGKRRVSQQMFIVDADRRITGYVEVTTLIASRERTPLLRIQQAVPLVLNARAPLHSVEDLDLWLSFDSLPVADRRGRFQGVLRREALIHEDHTQLSGISADREFKRTRTALADIFWLAIGSLLAPRESHVFQNRTED